MTPSSLSLQITEQSAVFSWVVGSSGAHCHSSLTESSLGVLYKPPWASKQASDGHEDEV